MDDHPGHREAINSYSLVAYLPEPLAGFVGQLRRELVPTCSARAHITILPPRPLYCGEHVAQSQIREALRNFQPFTAQFGEVRFFPQTNVIYISILHGYSELEELHQLLNRGSSGCQETFPYHPHLTLAQQIDPGAMAAAGELVSQRWQEFQHAREFEVEELTFVQNTSDNVWMDLAEIPLGVALAV